MIQMRSKYTSKTVSQMAVPKASHHKHIPTSTIFTLTLVVLKPVYSDLLGYVDRLVPNCGNSILMELLQSCNRPSILCLQISSVDYRGQSCSCLVWRMLSNTCVSASRYDTKCKYIEGIVQHCSISSALAMEILQFCTRQSAISCFTK